MTFPTHIMLGLIIGKATGNYPLAITSSVFTDLDHVYSYVKSGIIYNPKLLWKTTTSRNDPYENQRGVLHNFFVFCAVSILLLFAFGLTSLPFVLGWLGHLFLDALDNSDYWPASPYKWLNLKGPILYASIGELFLFLSLLIIFFLL